MRLQIRCASTSGKREILTGFAGSVAVDGILIASTDGTVGVIYTVSRFERGIHTGGDIFALVMDEYEHSELPWVVTIVPQYIPNDEADVDFFTAGDLARNDYFSLRCHDLAGNTGRLVFSETGIKDAVGDEVT